MRLAKLHMAGFKSFSEPAELALDDGVTAIVGSNGCGKSNVVDAITWVLGEQSAKSMRGDRMEDVIFSGSDDRKPTAAAEVRLMLSQVEQAAMQGVLLRTARAAEQRADRTRFRRHSVRPIDRGGVRRPRRRSGAAEIARCSQGEGLLALTYPTPDADWLRDCLGHYRRALDADVIASLVRLKELVTATRARGGKLICAGNGASSAIASHAAADYTKAAGVRAVTFHDVDLITCFANDFGYERWIEQALAAYADDADLVILISSSGWSPNVLRAAEYARGRGLTVVTLTGFAPDNPLRQLGDLSLWVDSRAYNVVESVHQIWLLMVCDLLVGFMEYPATRGARDSGAATPST